MYLSGLEAQMLPQPHHVLFLVCLFLPVVSWEVLEAPVVPFVVPVVHSYNKGEKNSYGKGVKETKSARVRNRYFAFLPQLFPHPLLPLFLSPPSLITFPLLSPTITYRAQQQARSRGTASSVPRHDVTRTGAW